MGFSRQEYWSRHFLLQGIFLDQELNLCLLHWQVGSLPLSHEGVLEGSLKVMMTKLGPGELFHGEITPTKAWRPDSERRGVNSSSEYQGSGGTERRGGERGVAELEMERSGEGRLGKAPSDALRSWEISSCGEQGAAEGL